MADDLRKLKDEAAKATEKGKHRRAAEIYLQVAQREKDEPMWPQRAAEALKRAGAAAEALPHFISAAEGYARQGLLLKAIALSKVILQIDPKHAATQALLASLYARQGKPAPAHGLAKPPSTRPVSVAPSAVAAAASPAPSLPRPPPLPPELRPPDPPRPVIAPPPPPSDGLLTIDDLLPEGGAELGMESEYVPLAPGAPVDALPLSEIFVGARKSEQFAIPSAYEIPLDEPELEVEPEPAPDPRVPSSPPKLPEIPLFSSLDERQLRRLIERIRRVERSAGQVVIREGDHGAELYVIARGEVEVTVAGLEKPVERLGEGAFFGELCVLTDCARTATVTAVTETELLEIDRAAIGELIEQDSAVLRTLLAFCRDRLIDRLIATSPMFAEFSPDDALDLASRFRFLELEAGATPVREGERANGLLVLLCGECEVRKGEQIIARLGPGDMVGEISLLRRAPAEASVLTKTRVWALGLPRDQFQEIIVTHPSVLIYVNDLADRRRAQSERVRLV